MCMCLIDIVVAMLPSFKRPPSLECTQLSVTMCMSSATGTLHVLEICAIEQIRRMC